MKMNKKLFGKKLRQIAGHLLVESRAEQRNFKLLNKSLAQSDLSDENNLLIKSNFSIGKSDLFFDETIPKKRLDILDQLATEKLDTEKEPKFRVFVREVPIREQLFHASIPDWAAGAKVSQSIGPFTHKDGRKFWYDFYPIKKLITLYIQGIAEPVLLFSINPAKPVRNIRATATDNNRIRATRTLNTRRSRASLSAVDGLTVAPQTKTYDLAKGSVWINSRFLALNAPVGTYTGLTINSGKITLSNQAVDLNEQLTVPANTIITVQINLGQPKVTDADEQSSFGIDARNLQLELPDNLTFHFSGQGRTIDKVGNAIWNLYGQSLSFNWNNQTQTTYDPVLQRIVFPYSASEQELQIIQTESEFNSLKHNAEISQSAWALSVATIDINQPTEAAGIGAMLVRCDAGLVDIWKGLEGGSFNLANPVFLASPGQIFLADLSAGNPHAHQSLSLWKDDENKFGSNIELTFPTAALFFYVSNANGSEQLMTFANADFQVDRPVTVNCQPPSVRSLNSLLVAAVSSEFKLIYLFDDNLIQDAAQLSKNDPVFSEPMALALSNALFRVSQVNGALLFGSLSDDYSKVENGFLFLTFGLYAYLPTLPDPYAANIGILKNQIRGKGRVPGAAPITGLFTTTQITSWLVCQIRWQAPAEEEDNNEVKVSFHFAPLSNQFAGISLDKPEADPTDNKPISVGRKIPLAAKSDQTNTIAIAPLNSAISSAIAAHNINVVASTLVTDTKVNTSAATTSNRKPLPDYEQQWDGTTGRLQRNLFALLDVSTNADLYGISFNLFGRQSDFVTTHVPVNNNSNSFPIQVKGMDVISQGQNVKAFTVPQISWEPLINLSPSVVTGDPPFGFNYYPNDGGAMQILNNSEDTVALAPLPLTDYLLSNFENKTDNFTAFSLMTLPFGMKALAVLQNQYNFTDENGVSSSRKGSNMRLNAEQFEDNLQGGLQLQLDGGDAYISGESDMFVGNTVQLNNVLDLTGNSQGDSTLGRTVTEIFNKEFFAEFMQQRGVPLTRIDLSGYGASIFSDWLNPEAAFAQTSQAKFDVFVGRCAHEIIQVRSIIYPWGIKVVRTISMFRVGSGYVYRIDSGWKPESNGEFDFRYFVKENPADKDNVEMKTPFDVHPGIIKRLFNVQNIIETDEIVTAEGTMVSEKIVNENNQYIDNPDSNNSVDFKLQPVYFDADIEIDDVISGFTRKKVNGKDKDLVPAKKIVGYVQLAPKGIPITAETLKNLVLIQLGSIGASIDCEINLATSDQKMRLNRFDFNNSFDENGKIIFAVAGRGNVLLPKEGSWTMVQHQRSSGEVSPVPSNLAIPVIREGLLVKDGSGQKLSISAEDVLLRIANPTELLRQPVTDTINYGFLQSTDTQKALFLTPSFEIGKKKLFSKTPPLFVDAFRIVNSKSIFPNIGIAEANNIGESISLISTNGSEFIKGSMQDLGGDVWELMDITGATENAKEQGYKLLKDASDDFSFDMPDQEFELIDVGDGNFRIYIEYEQNDKDGNPQSKGKLDFDIDSLANNVADSWKSKMENIGLVIDLAGIERLMTIRGSWDSKKGSEASYPQPELVFSKELQPVIDILEILQQLNKANYAGAVANGLKLAMSNKAGTWEYKFEASKEIPVLRFPVPDALYNDPNTPLKLEAGLTIGAYFNAALKVTNDANELLPSAGGILGFYGRLSVMCVSLSAATVYALGQVNLDIAADTKIGPSLRMKFGFGAQIVIGLPVAGNVSVLFVVGIEIFAAESIIEVSAFMLFEGHAEILGGIVAITIRIEAKGTVSKKMIGDESRTDLACQVTFGLDISIFLVININFETSWSEQRQIAGSKKL